MSLSSLSLAGLLLVAQAPQQDPVKFVIPLPVTNDSTFAQLAATENKQLIAFGTDFFGVEVGAPVNPLKDNPQVFGWPLDSAAENKQPLDFYLGLVGANQEPPPEPQENPEEQPVFTFMLDLMLIHAKSYRFNH
jgi:hypothetical protein